jgi:mercuric ion transport protein
MVVRSVNKTTRNRQIRFADSAGVLGAILAALCCAGTPVILAALAALGLSSLRNDFILWPAMIISLVVALWGFWMGQRTHGSARPLILAAVGGVSLVAGVIFVHGFPAMQLIAGGAVALVVATVWTIVLRRSCNANR